MPAVPARIAIDARKIRDFGIGTYVRNLLVEYSRVDNGDTYVVICRPGDREFVEALGPRFEAMPDASGNYSVREQLSLPLDIRRARVQLFHAPHYVVPPLTPGRIVVTIHDCIHLRFPQYLPHRAALYYAKGFMRMGARRARRILTVSQASKDDIQQYLHVPANKIDVIHNGLDARFLAPPDDELLTRVRQRFQLTAPFVLYTGNIKPHKNVDRLIDAFARLRQDGHHDLKLLIIGDDSSRYPSLRRQVHRHHLHAHVRFLGFVPDETLAALYRLASLFVFPSLFEGFGFPPLEAMASGTPVITSNVSSLPEVVGDAAVLVNPLDAEAIAQAMARVLADARLRRELIARGLERAQTFRWADAAAQTRAVYAQVLGA